MGRFIYDVFVPKAHGAKEFRLVAHGFPLPHSHLASKQQIATVRHIATANSLAQNGRVIHSPGELPASLSPLPCNGAIGFLDGLRSPAVRVVESHLP